MYTDASKWIGATTYFPGPWQLWWMSIPIRVLGTTWGPLLSMAVLNSGWFLLAGWFVRRRLGDRAAMGALIFLAALTWTLGTGAMYSPVPMVMIVPAFAAFCFGCWALAAGDEGVLPLLILLTNFLLLDHLALTLLVSVIVGAALLMWAIGLVVARQAEHTTWAPRRRRARRAVLVAGAITLVMWLPPIIQELRNEPGNLTNLSRAAAARPPQDPIWGTAYGALTAFFAKPPFWLHGSRTHSALMFNALPPSGTAQIVTSGVLGLCAIGLGWSAWVRRDRAAGVAIGLAVVMFLSAWYNIAHPAQTTDLMLYLPRYFLSSWPIAMFVTFALGYGLVKALPAAPRRIWPALPIVVAALLAIANIPHSNIAINTGAADDRLIAVSSTLNPRVIRAVEDQPSVAIAAPQLRAYGYVASLAVALADARISFCYDGIPQFSGTSLPRCPKSSGAPSIQVHPRFPSPSIPADAKVIARSTPLGAAERAQRRQLDRQIRAALKNVDHLEPAPGYWDLMRILETTGQTSEQPAAPPVLSTPGGPMVTQQSRIEFARLILAVHDIAKGSGYEAVTIPGVSSAELLRWAELVRLRADYGFVVTMTSPT